MGIKALGLGTLLAISSVVTSSTISALFIITFIAFFNMSILQTTALRGLVGVVQSAVLFIAFAMQGYLIRQHVIAGFIGGSIGSYIGTKYAIRKGVSRLQNIR